MLFAVFLFLGILCLINLLMFMFVIVIIQRKGGNQWKKKRGK